MHGRLGHKWLCECGEYIEVNIEIILSYKKDYRRRSNYDVVNNFFLHFVHSLQRNGYISDNLLLLQCGVDVVRAEQVASFNVLAGIFVFVLGQK